jgi:hypothetical protein
MDDDISTMKYDYTPPTKKASNTQPKQESSSSKSHFESEEREAQQVGIEPKVAASATKDVEFWTENPNVLLNPSYVSELFPASNMTYNQKLNAVTRMILLLSLTMFLYLRTFRSVLFGVISIGVVYLVHYYYNLDKTKTTAAASKKMGEGFTDLDGQDETTSPALAVIGGNMNLTSPSNVFDSPTPENPFSNVLLTDIQGQPNKKPAGPAYNVNINQKILDSAKQAVVNANPDQPDITDKLFKDLGEQMTFEQSMRQFYSTPSTNTPDDQQAFAEFCYGSMISCAEGNKFACARNAAAMRHTLG